MSSPTGRITLELYLVLVKMADKYTLKSYRINPNETVPGQREKCDGSARKAPQRMDTKLSEIATNLDAFVTIRWAAFQPRAVIFSKGYSYVW